MNAVEELLGIDLESDSVARATQLARNDRALLRKLIEVRKMQGLTQTEVADRMGVTQATVSRFEDSDSNPTLATIRRYAHAVEALVNHDVERDEGQLRDPSKQARWMSTSLDGSSPTATTRWDDDDHAKFALGAASFPQAGSYGYVHQRFLSLAA